MSDFWGELWGVPSARKHALTQIWWTKLTWCFQTSYSVSLLASRGWVVWSASSRAWTNILKHLQYLCHHRENPIKTCCLWMGNLFVPSNYTRSRNHDSRGSVVWSPHADTAIVWSKCCSAPAAPLPPSLLLAAQNWLQSVWVMRSKSVQKWTDTSTSPGLWYICIYPRAPIIFDLLVQRCVLFHFFTHLLFRVSVLMLQKWFKIIHLSVGRREGHMTQGRKY